MAPVVASKVNTGETVWSAAVALTVRIMIGPWSPRRSCATSRSPRSESGSTTLRLEVVRLASLVPRRGPTPAPRPWSRATSTTPTGSIADDDAVDSLRHAIEDECLRILGLPGSCAADLRFVGVALRVAHELERSADLMVNVARTTWRLHPDRVDDVAGHAGRPH